MGLVQERQAQEAAVRGPEPPPDPRQGERLQKGLRPIDTAVLDWFTQERGIKPETLGAYSVEQSGEWLTFPYPNGEKLRRLPTLEGPRQFRFTQGKAPELYVGQWFGEYSVAFIVEGETDAMRLYQEVGESADVAGLSGIETWQPHFADYFKNHDRVYVVLDNDQDYNVRARVDSCWKQIRNDLGGKKAKRVVLPADVKDICEFFDKYDVELLRELCVRKSPILSRLGRLNLMTPAPSPDWLVEDYIASGDVHLLVGDPGLGKSWLTMDLAIRVAEGGGKWLGRRVMKAGPVLYVDEENPEDIILNRFQRLGLSDRSAKNIHFLHRPGIWLNKEPDVLLDEALEIEPRLIVLDALTALHSVEENNANAMRTLFREAIIPLARDTGAAVIVIHHTTKAEDASSFKRARGTGDLSAVVDCAMDARGTDEPGHFTLSQYKSRRRLGGEVLSVQIEDTLEGGVRLVTRDPVF